ncbi:UNVERIFIED_CONTAM: hypothetical protein Slati_3154100 [Sesamum latifolium]|uniref:Reverse transcriptase zinc-binding domain-containing protein n=1 Tax=Sesamum latifolium TaxID=2727402 RepID=A0AAW2UWR7_9LAMI
MLKARYFLQGSFFEAAGGVRPSYVWRLLLCAHLLLELGLLVQPLSVQQDQYVSSLLHLDGSWREDEVRVNFVAVDAEWIVQISVQEGEADNLGWHFNLHGCFSVKNAYQVAQGSQATSCSSHGSSTSSAESSWSFIWRPKAVPNVLLFAWKCCKRAVLSVSNLRRRGVIGDSSCVLCGLEEGDVMHMLADWRIAPMQGSVGR